MTVVFDATTEQQRSASAAVTTFSHTAGAGTKGILVGFVRGGTDVAISLVSYGGTTLVKIIKAVDTATEPGTAEWWFAAHTATGAQTVSYSPGTVGSNIHAVAVTVTADATPYALSSQIEQENTTSASVSLTTGYVQGMAFGAYYGGGATPTSFTYATTLSILHDWDMGAFYSEMFNTTTATAAGSGPLLDFGGVDQAGTDDVAFAALFLTDGVIKPGVGAIASGSVLAAIPPTIVNTVNTTKPTVGLVTAGLSGGLVPVSVGYVFPSVGAVGVNNTTTGPIIYVVPAAINTHIPVVTGYVFPPVGAVATVTQLPTVTDISVAPAATPAVGLVTAGLAGGLVPAELRELKSGIGVGLVTAGLGGGLIPGELRELKDGIDVGLVTAGLAGGLIPALKVEFKQGVGVGLVTAAGQIPGEYRELKETISVGLVTAGLAGGLIPALLKNQALAPTVGLVTAGLAGGLVPGELRELKQAVGVGLAIAQGQIPTFGVVGEATAIAGRGEVVAAGLVPALLKDDAVGPTAGLAVVGGLVPALATELKQLVDVGLAIAQGLIPVMDTGAVVVTGTALPDVGMVIADGLAPALAVEYDKPRGHVATGKKRRRGKTPVYDLSQTMTAVVKLPYELTPQPIAYFDPAPIAIAGIDTAAVATIEGQLTVLEEQKRQTARRRREEEEIITLWLRAA